MMSVKNYGTTNDEYTHRLNGFITLNYLGEKFLPDLILGRLYIECKRYGSGAEPLEAWWKQVLEASEGRGIPVLIYKFNRRPIKIKMPLWAVNPYLEEDASKTTELLWDDFIFVLKNLYREDIEANDRD